MRFIRVPFSRAGSIHLKARNNFQKLLFCILGDVGPKTVPSISRHLQLKKVVKVGQNDFFEKLTIHIPVCTGGGADLPTILRFVDFSCMSITVLSQKTRVSYVPRFNFGRLFLDKKFGVQIANVKNF